MIEIILIEDRPGRQEQFLNEDLMIILESMPYLTMLKEVNCRKLINDINSEETTILSKYSLIMIHRSSLNPIGLKALEAVCKKNKIDLILFSGGLSQLIYAKNIHQSLSINSKTFYNNNIIDFLEKYSQDKTTSLLYLVYQSKWRLELLMRYRQIKTREKYEEDEYVKVMLEEEAGEILINAGVLPDDVDSEIEKIITSL